VRNWLVMMKFAFRVIFTRPPFSKWLPTKSTNCQWSPISMKNDHWNRRPLTICRFCWRPFWKRWHRKNDPECNFYHYQSIPHFKITLHINFHWNQRTVKFGRLICIQGHFYEATIFKMAANKIDKLSMISDFNEKWYLGLFWSEELIFIEIREQWNLADFVGGHFENKNDPECNFHHEQSIPHFKITLDINFHWNQRTLKFC
jgi:hypothetical protein